MAGRGSPKKRTLPTRKGSRNHKGVDSGSNFAALRKQADLGLVAERQPWTKETSSKRKVRGLQGQRNVIRLLPAGLAGHPVATSPPQGQSTAPTHLPCFSCKLETEEGGMSYRTYARCTAHAIDRFIANMEQN